MVGYQREKELQPHMPADTKSSRRSSRGSGVMRDKQRLEVTTDDSEVVEALNQFMDEVLGYGSNPQCILHYADESPSSVLLNTLAAYPGACSVFKCAHAGRIF